MRGSVGDVRSGRGGRVAVVAAAVAVVFPLGGCGVPLVPISAPSDPMAMKVTSEGDVVFRWCGEDDEIGNFLRVTYRIYAEKRIEEVAAEGLGDGSIHLAHGESFSTTSPPSGVTYDLSKPIPVTNHRTTVFIVSGPERGKLDGAGIHVTLDMPSMSELPRGQWVHPDGDITVEACPR